MSPSFPPPLRVFTTVGTDHHPFDRLVGWMHRWHRANPDAVGTLQYGTSRPPGELPGVAASDLVAYEAMVEAFTAADVVVCHGGPATIMDARYAGTLPVVLPRSSGHGEHVDDHQVRFARRLAELGQVVLVGSYDELDTALEKAMVDRDAYRLQDEAAGTLPAVRAFAAQVRSLGPGGVDPTPQPTLGPLRRLRDARRRMAQRA